MSSVLLEAYRCGLDRFVRIGGMIHATCHSISAIENFAGPFLTTLPQTISPSTGLVKVTVGGLFCSFRVAWALTLYWPPLASEPVNWTVLTNVAVVAAGVDALRLMGNGTPIGNGLGMTGGFQVRTVGLGPPPAMLLGGGTAPTNVRPAGRVSTVRTDKVTAKAQREVGL